MSPPKFSYEKRFIVALEHPGDPRAMGGAVTVALCGHWDHEGPCRWPHHTEAQAAEDGTYRVIVRFDSSEDEHQAVSDLIDGALGSGAQAGPDGRMSRWTMVATHS